jgi:hypothetical protein
VVQRAVVSGARKSQLLTRAMAQALDPPRSDIAAFEAAPLAATRYLVEAVQTAVIVPDAEPRPKTYAERIVWMFGLFERLERRDQLLRQGASA